MPQRRTCRGQLVTVIVTLRKFFLERDDHTCQLKLRFHPQEYTKWVEQVHQGNKTEQPDDVALAMNQSDDPSEQTRLIKSDSSGRSLHFTAAHCCSLLFILSTAGASWACDSSFPALAFGSGDRVPYTWCGRENRM